MIDQARSWAHDLGAGCLIAVVGTGAIAIGQSYGIGSLQQMGPGFFPVAVGAILVGIGIALAIGALKTRAAQPDSGLPLFDRPDWRGWVFIVGGVLAFLLLGAKTGLIPAAFGCVFISSLGDRSVNVRRALLLAAAVTVLGTILFSFILKVQMPMLTWGRP